MFLLNSGGVCFCFDSYSHFFQALRSFEKGVHLDPTNSELWKEDLEWARELVEKKNVADAGTLKLNTKLWHVKLKEWQNSNEDLVGCYSPSKTHGMEFHRRDEFVLQTYNTRYMIVWCIFVYNYRGMRLFWNGIPYVMHKSTLQIIIHHCLANVVFVSILSVLCLVPSLDMQLSTIYITTTYHQI